MQASVVRTRVAAVVVHIWAYPGLAAAAPVDSPTPSSMLAESTLSVDVNSPTTNYTSVNSRLYLIAGMTIGIFLIIVFIGGFYLRVRLQRARGSYRST
ncbi:hypothetical protein DL89DRAFT_14991 [Linderina pennispora]|uniref:Mid2 domain-containing protein n=1 Tax=Linderina pennispora TaxID=61395 RepID=A0A1Y1WLW6_9FUNG|nr:uncharacterized protein DL89DRAFT_14991 [Linderina pennispora]ORX74365.1 hypothetical protein DL89DRAFT_14991 [Linderina pennispora]